MGTFSFAKSHNERLKITKKQQKEIRGIYNRMAKEAAQRAEALKGSTKSGALQAIELEKLSKELKGYAKEVGEQVKAGTQKAMKQTSEAVVGDARAFNKGVGLVIDGAYSRVPADVVSALSSGQLYPGDWSLSKAIWADVKNTQKDINRIVAEGAALNKSSYEIAKDLEKYVDPNAKKDWDWNKVYPGTKRKVDYAAQRLARTMISHAYQTSLVSVVEKNPFVEGIRWQASHSSRTCELCAERDGVVFAKDKLPLDHPNGLCTYIAEMSKDMKDIANELADWVEGKENPALDTWTKVMGGIAQPKFSKAQHEWLTPLGYTPSKMPTDFKEFAMSLSHKKQSEFLQLAGATWDHPHPYQQMEAWYLKNLAQSVPSKATPVPSVKEVVKEVKVKKGKVSRERIVELRESQGHEHKQALTEAMESWWSQLKEDHRHAVRRYTSSLYNAMNTALRTGHTPEDLVAKYIKDGTTALNKAKLPVDTIVVRGSYGDGLCGILGVEHPGTDIVDWVKENRDKIVGVVAEDKGFLSTSIAQGFSSREVRYYIFAPKGSKGSYVAKYSEFTSEEEVVFAPGTKMRIIDVEPEQNNRAVNVFMEILK